MRTNKNPYATRSSAVAMECDTEDEEFIPGVRDILDAIRQATLSPPPPPSPTLRRLPSTPWSWLWPQSWSLSTSVSLPHKTLNHSMAGLACLYGFSPRLLTLSPNINLPQTSPPTEDDIAASFARNPEIMKLSITRPPRWIRNPFNIASAHSLFVFAFEDPNGSIARRLLNSSLFAFGTHQMLARKPKIQETPHPPGTQEEEGPRP